MRNLLEHLRTCTADTFHYSKGTGKKIVLTEFDPGAACTEVVIDSKNIQTFVLQLDQQPAPDIHPLLSSGEPELRKRCDYILFCLKENSIICLLIELKSYNPGRWIKQCIAGKAITDYIVSMIDNKFDTNYSGNIEFRMLNFNMKRASGLKGRKKKKTQVSGLSFNRHPQTGILFAHRPCNTNYPDIGIFLK